MGSLEGGVRSSSGSGLGVVVVVVSGEWCFGEFVERHSSEREFGFVIV